VLTPLQILLGMLHRKIFVVVENIQKDGLILHTVSLRIFFAMFLTGSYILHMVNKGLIGLTQILSSYFAQLHHVHAGVCCTHLSVRYIVQASNRSVHD
jgi:hypothetical protein